MDEGALPQKLTVPKRQFLRMASSDFLDSRKGCLWKSSLPCIKNRRFRGAVHFGRAVWDERCAKKSGNPDGLPGFFRHSSFKTAGLKLPGTPETAAFDAELEGFSQAPFVFVKKI